MNKNSKKCLVVFGPLRISEEPQSFKGKGPGDPFDLFLISKPGNHIKGTDHDFCWSENPIYHLQKHGNIHIFQNK